MSASAAVPVDSVYIHCDNAGGDFRISELNHSLSQFSERYQEYRPVCPECEIIEWDNRITMKDAARTFIQINRVSGFVLVQRNNTKASGPFDIYSFQGTCRRATMVMPKKRVAGARVF